MNTSPLSKLLTLLGFNHETIFNIEKAKLNKLFEIYSESVIEEFLKKDFKDKVAEFQLLATDLMKYYKQLKICQDSNLEDEAREIEKQYSQVKVEIKQKLTNFQGWDLKFMQLSVYSEAKIFGINTKISLDEIIKILGEVSVIQLNGAGILISEILGMSRFELEYPKKRRIWSIFGECSKGIDEVKSQELIIN